MPSQRRERLGLRGRRRIWQGVIWLILIAGFVVLVKGFPEPESWRALVAPEQRRGILALVTIAFVVMTLRAVRWGVLLIGHVPFSWSQLIRVFGWCFVLMMLTPFRAGEAARALWVRRQGGSASAGMGILVAERLVDFLVLLAMLGLVGSLSQNTPPALVRLSRIWLIVTVLIYLLVSTSYLWLGALRRRSRQPSVTLERPAPLRSLAGKVMRVGEGLGSLGNLGKNLTVLGLTVAIWALLALGFQIYLRGFFPDLPWWVAVIVLCLVNLSMLFMIAPGHLGVYEMAVVLGLGSWNIGGQEALVAAVGLHSVVLLANLGYGLVCRIRTGGESGGWWEVL